jgi:hypothetical protein
MFLAIPRSHSIAYSHFLAIQSANGEWKNQSCIMIERLWQVWSENSKRSQKLIGF